MANRKSRYIEVLKKVYRHCNKSGLFSAIIDTLLVTAFTLQSTFYYAVNFWRKGKIATMGDVLLSGDFLLFSISFLSSAYLMYNQARVVDSDWKDNMNKVIVFIIMVISGIYVMMKSDQETSLIFAFWISVGAFVIAIIIFFRAQLLLKRPPTDVGEVRHEEQQNIADGLS